MALEITTRNRRLTVQIASRVAENRMISKFIRVPAQNMLKDLNHAYMLETPCISANEHQQERA